MRAGYVAPRIGLPRKTVSTSPSKVAKTGAIQQPDHGCRLSPHAAGETGAAEPTEAPVSKAS